jgi:membrane protein involved in colicin uptake
MPEPTPAPTTGPTNEGGAPAEGGQSTEERTFTQADLDRILSGRLAKFADYDQLKEQAEKAQRDAQTEQERAVSDARKEARAEALAEANARLIRAETRGIAADLGWLYPADAHLYLSGAEGLVTESGEVDVAAIEAALKAEADKRPALVKAKDDKPTPSASDAGIGTGGGAPKRHAGGDFLAGL